MRRQSQGKGQRITALIFGIVLGVAILSGGIACMSLGIAAVADAGYITDTGVSDGFAIAGQLMLVLGIVGMVSGVFAIIGGAITMAGKTAGPVFMLLAWLMAIASAIGLNWMAIPAAVFFFIAMILGFAGVKKAKRARNSGDGNNDRFNSSNQNQQW